MDKNNVNSIVNSAAGAINAAAKYFTAAVSLAVSNPFFLGFTVILLISAGKSLKLGKVISVKG